MPKKTKTKAVIKNKATTLEKTKGGKIKTQPGKEDIQNTIRPHVYDLIARAIHISQYGDSDSNKLGAIKLLLSKVVPDMKATEISTDDQIKWLFAITQDNTLRDANKKGKPTDKALSKAS